MEKQMRKHWIDNLRWATVVLVLIYHVFYFYNNKGVFGGIGGFSDDPMAQPQDAIMYILYPWFMMLLFLVAGISARYSLDKQTTHNLINSFTKAEQDATVANVLGVGYIEPSLLGKRFITDGTIKATVLFPLKKQLKGACMKWGEYD